MQPAPLRVGIVGAGYGGLACALALYADAGAVAAAAAGGAAELHHTSTQAHQIQVQCLEAAASVSAGRTGGVTVPSAPAVLQSFGMKTAWDELREESRSAKEYSVPIQSLREKMIHRLTLLKTVAVEYSVQVVNIVQEDTSASTSIDDSGSNDSGRNSSDGSGSSSNGRSGGSGGGDNSGGARGRRFSRKKRLVTAPTRRRRATGRARTNITIQKSEGLEGLFSEEEEEKEEEELEEAAAAAAACSSNSNDRHGELDGSGDHSVTNRSQRGTASIFSTLVSAYTDTDADTSAIYFCECHDGSRRGPFDMIVDAAGLTWLQLQPPLDQPSCAAAVAAVGDARAARSSSGWDAFGVWRVRRVKYGADDALRDGADLGNGLRTGRYRPGNLGKYSCTALKATPRTPTDARGFWKVLLAAGLVCKLVGLMISWLQQWNPRLDALFEFSIN